MSDKTSQNSLVPSGKCGLVQSDHSGNKLIQRAASDALVPIQTMMNQQASTRHRVGTREFHDEDYQQLQVWASELGIEGGLDKFVEVFDSFFRELVAKGDPRVSTYFRLENAMDWLRNDRIRFFADFGGGKLSSPLLPKLKHFHLMPENGSTLSKKLNLPGVPALTHLGCEGNQLSELDLSSVPTLRTPVCHHNQLSELDLSSVPALTHLSCHNNQLSELDLSSVPALLYLNCFMSELNELDLSSVQSLEYLLCGANQLTELYLPSVPALTNLDCDHNQLSQLNLPLAPALVFLSCSNNLLSELDLSSAPHLLDLRCEGNQLSKLDIRNCLYLKSVKVDPWVVVHKRPDQTVEHPKEV